MAADLSRFPIRVSPNGRYFVDAKGVPFFILGTTQWELFRGYSLEDAVTIIQGSSRAGFTFIQTKLLGGGDGTKPNVAGHKPFVNDDPLTPNEVYFRNVDAVVAAAREAGILISFSIFHQSYRAIFPLEKARPWARWFAARYTDAPHIFWNITPEQSDAYTPIIREFAAGLREADKGRHLITFKPDPAPCTSSFLHADPWLDFNCIQTWKDVNLIVPMVRHDYGLKPTKPVVMAEGAYEEGSEYGFPVTPLWVRRQAYYTYLLGSHHGYGHNDAWRILPNWKKSLAAPGALQMGILRKIFEAIAEWWLLVPDQDLLAKGARDDGEILTLAARHERGRWAMVYLAEPGRCTVRMDRLVPAAVRAAWIDPRSGSAVEIGRLENRGAKEFVTPAGWEDALLVLEAPR
jgi:hypothetical protein